MVQGRNPDVCHIMTAHLAPELVKALRGGLVELPQTADGRFGPSVVASRVMISVAVSGDSSSEAAGSLWPPRWRLDVARVPDHSSRC